MDILTGEKYSTPAKFEVKIDQRNIKNDNFIKTKLSDGIKLAWTYIKPDGSLSIDSADIRDFYPDSQFVTLPHLSQWILIQAASALPLTNLTNGVSGIVIYPNPYRPNNGNNATGVKYNGNPGSGINFHAPQENLTIEIYTINGEKVSRFTTTAAQIAANGNVIQWDVKNDNGNEIASGVYIALFKGQSGTRYSKFSVIK